MDEDEFAVNEALVRWRLDDMGEAAADLAAYLKVSEPYLSQMLKGHRRMSMARLRMTARFLGMHHTLLIRETEPVAA